MLIYRKSLLVITLVLDVLSTRGTFADPDTFCGIHQLSGCSVQELESLGVNVHININMPNHDYPDVFQGGHGRRLYKKDDKKVFHKRVSSGRGRNDTLSACHRFIGHLYSPVRRI